MIPMPIVTKESAKLKTYQCRSPIIKSRKSTTSPKKIRSIKFPIAPASIKATPVRTTISSSLKNKDISFIKNPFQIFSVYKWGYRDRA